jgi:ABC-type multidrug transport system fused ATPase/permease subunit
VSSNVERIREAIGDKFGIMIKAVTQIVAGYTIALLYSWQLTLVILSLTPVMACAGFAASFVSFVTSIRTPHIFVCSSCKN